MDIAHTQGCGTQQNTINEFDDRCFHIRGKLFKRLILDNFELINSSVHQAIKIIDINLTAWYRYHRQRDHQRFRDMS